MDAGAPRHVKVALVAFDDPYLLPPTMNAAKALAAQGWQVEVHGIRWRTRVAQQDPSPGVTVRLHGEVGPGIAHYVAYARFFAQCVVAAARRRHDWIYAYDLMAAPVGQAMARAAGARWVYHGHDVPSLSRGLRLIRALPRSLRAARRADLVVFPQAERARLFALEAGLETSPRIVFNCPPRDWLDGAEGDAEVAAFQRRWPRFVVYQGGLGRSLGTAALIESLPYWPPDVGLVLVGDHTRPEASALRRENPNDRVLWRGAVSYHQLPAITRAASLGVLITPCPDDNLNLLHLAGASNKVFEYLAAGLPVLVPDTPGFQALIEKPRHGELCHDASPEALGAQISRLLSDEKAAQAMAQRNVAAFRSTFHYEHQFSPIIRAMSALTPRRG